MIKTKLNINKILILLAMPMLFLFFDPSKAEAATRMPENIPMTVDGGAAGMVRAINAAYDNNLYISLRDSAVLFAPTGHAFGLDINGGSAEIITGQPYSDELEHYGWNSEQMEQYAGGDPANSALLVDGENRRYYTILMGMDGYYDCFISPMDLAMILNVNMEMGDNGISVDTTTELDINPARMESDDYFDGFNTVVVGDATTGEVFYGYNMDIPHPIASTTKLMTYLLTMDAVNSGKIGIEDKAVVSKAAADLSASSDGAVAMAEGWEIPVSELILGALLPSSNECALTLAEYVGGNEAEFVKMMNGKAEELGLKSAVFYNSNGLPVYSETIIAAKKQNKMSGYDMFRMCAHILNTYPQVKEITSQKTARMPTLNKDLKNTNGLLYNMPEVNGLKTGTTDRSGACLVTSLTVPAGDGNHDLIVVALGAENSQARLRVSELMARYGKNVIEGKAAKISYSVGNDEDEKAGKITAELIVKTVVDYALRK